MICQRTGYCCINLTVIVVIPEAEGTLGVYEKPAGVQCPNLSFDDENKASCEVHDEPWFETTPCHRYQNSHEDPDFIGKRGRPCMLGPMISKTRDLVQMGTKPDYSELRRFQDFEAPTVSRL